MCSSLTEATLSTHLWYALCICTITIRSGSNCVLLRTGGYLHGHQDTARTVGIKQQLTRKPCPAELATMGKWDDAGNHSIRPSLTDFHFQFRDRIFSSQPPMRISKLARHVVLLLNVSINTCFRK